MLQTAGHPGGFTAVILPRLAPGTPVSNGHNLLATPRFVGYAWYIYHFLSASSLESTDNTQFSDIGKRRLITKVVSRIYSLLFAW